MSHAVAILAEAPQREEELSCYLPFPPVENGYLAYPEERRLSRLPRDKRHAKNTSRLQRTEGNLIASAHHRFFFFFFFFFRSVLMTAAVSDHDEYD